MKDVTLSAWTLGLAVLLAGLPSQAQDGDADGIRDSVDNCPALANADQRDQDGDGFGNSCDCEDATYTIRQVPSGGVPRLALASCADLNGDGAAELILGHPGALTADCIDAQGKVTVLSGLDRSIVYEFLSPENCDGFGSAVADGGDVDGDGVHDILVGAKLGGGKGRVYVYSGTTGELLFTSQGERSSLDGQRNGDFFGSAVVRLGDVTGDGIDEFVVSAPRFDANGDAEGRPGRVAIFRGGRAADLQAGTSIFGVEGEHPGEIFGAALDAGDDFNADGVPDLVVAASPERPTAVGRVLIISGIDGTLLFEHAAEIPEDQFPKAVAFVDDLNGDGFADVLAGAPAGAGVTTSPGKVIVIAGGDPATGGQEPRVLDVIEGRGDGDLFGGSLATLGDQDGDGITDFAIGAAGATVGGDPRRGRVAIFSGAFSSSGFTRLAEFDGSGAERTYGFALSDAGDVDADGIVDLFAAEVRRSNRAFVYRLGDLDRDGRRDACQPCRQPTPLLPETPLQFDLCPVAADRCFSFAGTPGKALRIRLEDQEVDPTTVMLWRWGGEPTPQRFDFAGTRESNSTQGIFVPQTRDDVGFLLVRTVKTGRCTESIRLLLEEIDGPTIEEITPAFTGNFDDTVDLEIRGAGFTGDLSFSLIEQANPAAVPQTVAGEAVIVGGDVVDVSFDLTGAPVGSYDVVAKEGETTVALLAGGFQVREARGTALQVAVRGPEFYRSRDHGSLTITYVNSSEVEMPTPLFRVRAPEAVEETFLKLPGDDEFRVGDLYFLGVGDDGISHRLTPGARGEVTLLFRNNLVCNQCPLAFEVSTFTPTESDFVPWRTLPNPNPEGLPIGEWERLLSPLSISLGRTWLDFYNALLEKAQRFGRRRETPISFDSLFSFAVEEARGAPVAAIAGQVLLTPSGIPVVETRVAAIADGTVRASTRTDTSGRYVLESLMAGATYDIAVENYPIENGEEGRVAMTLPDAISSTGSSGDLLNVTLDVIAGESSLDEAQDLPGALDDLYFTLPDKLFTSVSFWEITVVSSRDPNKKTDCVVPGEVLFGSEDMDQPDGKANGAGVGSPSTPEFALDYTIFFENSRCASLPARKIEVIDTLDARLFDVTTLRLQSMSLGEDRDDKLIVMDEPLWGVWHVARTIDDVHVAIVDPGRTLDPECAPENRECDDEPDGAEPLELGDPCRLPECDMPVDAEPTVVDYRNIGAVQVDIQMTAVPEDSNLFTLTWTMESEIGGLDGFLPPNDCTTHQGEGFVTFVIAPAAVAEVENDVEIVFDQDQRFALSDHVETSLVATDVPAAAAGAVPADNPTADPTVTVGEDQPLSWSPVLFADGYELKVSKLVDGKPTVVYDSLELTGSFFRPEKPWESGATYEWEIVATNDHGPSATSRWTFRVAGAPPPPPGAALVPVFPPDGDAGVKTGSAFEWSDGTAASSETYTIYIWKTTSGPGEPMAHVGQATAYQAFDLAEGTTYSWQVVAANTGGETTGPVWTFSTAATAFRRGDVDADTVVELTDGIVILNFLFLGTAELPCARAADIDDTGGLELTDAVALLNFLFNGGPPAEPPAVECGTDPTPDELTCDAFAPCE